MDKLQFCFAYILSRFFSTFHSTLGQMGGFSSFKTFLSEKIVPPSNMRSKIVLKE